MSVLAGWQGVAGWQGAPGRIDYLGAPLVADGMTGPKTQWAQYLETRDEWRQTAVRAMLTLRTLRENAVNRGVIQDYVLRLAGAPEGSPYCAATYSWALWLTGMCRRGFVPDASVARLRAALRPVEPDRVQPGDFASLLHPDGTGHGGMVIWPGVDWIASCDANISDSVDVIRYPIGERQYFSPVLGGFSRGPGEVPGSIRQYGTGETTR